MCYQTAPACKSLAQWDKPMQRHAVDFIVPVLTQHFINSKYVNPTIVAAKMLVRLFVSPISPDRLPTDLSPHRDV